MNEITSTIKEKTNIIDKNYKDTNKKIDDTSSYLNTIKTYEATIPKKIDDFNNDVKDIFSRISTYMTK
jgi:archaellum component FlaC